MNDEFRLLVVNQCIKTYPWTRDESVANVNSFFDVFLKVVVSLSLSRFKSQLLNVVVAQQLKQLAEDPTAQLVSPSPLVDDVWHVALLFTQEYADYCAREVGFFVHHRPQGERNQRLRKKYCRF